MYDIIKELAIRSLILESVREKLVEFLVLPFRARSIPASDRGVALFVVDNFLLFPILSLWV